MHSANLSLRLALAPLCLSAVTVFTLPSDALAQPWPASDLESNTEVFCFASGDVDEDQRTDLIAGTNDLSVLVYRHGADGLELAQTVELADDPMALSVADLDGDGDEDILYGTRGAASGGWIPNEGDGTFGAPIVLFTPVDRPTRVLALDIDGDGDRDFVYLEGTGNQSLMVLYNDGGGAFSSFDVISEGVSSIGELGFGGPGGVPVVIYITTAGEYRLALWTATGFEHETYAQFPEIAWAGLGSSGAPAAVVWSTAGGPTPVPALLQAQADGNGFEWPDVGASVVSGRPLLEARYADSNTLQFLDADTAGSVVRGWRQSGSEFIAENLAENTNQGNGWPAVHLADLDGDCDLDLVRDDFDPVERIVVGWNPIFDSIGDADGDGVGLCGGDCDDADASLGNIGDDGDCDGLLTADDCDDADPESASRLEDGDCDGLPTAEDCDDADPASNAIFEDRDCDGALSADDCDDLEPLALPGGEELCDDIDNDCDGEVDQGLDCREGGLPIGEGPGGCCAEPDVNGSWVGLLALGLLGRRRREPEE